MSVIEGIIFGIVQGITEFLPVSSSGHLSVLRHFFGVDAGGAGLFAALLHIGTLVAILCAYYKTLYGLFMECIACVKDIFAHKFTLNPYKVSPMRRLLYMFVISCVPLLVLLIPVGNGNSLKDAVGVFASDSSILAEGMCFLVTGFLLLLGSAFAANTPKPRHVTPGSAFVIGVAQLVAACFPGISRSGSTISAGLCCRVSKREMVRYSFVLSVPAVCASALSECKDALEAPEFVNVWALLAGVVTSAIVGIFAIRLLNVLLKKNRFQYFGYYCLGLGSVVTVLGIIEKLTGIYIGVNG